MVFGATATPTLCFRLPPRLPYYARARELLGYDPTTSVREGLVAEFEWMAQRAT